MDQSSPKYLSLQRLSVHSSLSVKTLRTFLTYTECPLPHYRLPRKILVHVDDFQAWMQRFRVEHPGVDLNKLVNELMLDL